MYLCTYLFQISLWHGSGFKNPYVLFKLYICKFYSRTYKNFSSFLNIFKKEIVFTIINTFVAHPRPIKMSLEFSKNLKTYRKFIFK